MRALLVVLILLLSGCAALAPTHTPAPAPAAKRFDFDGVAQPGVRLPQDLPTMGRNAHAFEADASFAFIEVNLTYDDPAQTGAVGLDAVLRDPWGRIQCFAIEAEPPKTCDAPIPRNMTAPAKWTVEVGGAWAADAPATSYHVAVALHPASDITLGDPAAGTDPRVAFRVTDTGVKGFEPTVGVLKDGTILAQELTRTVRSRDEGRSWQDVTPTIPHPNTEDAMMRVDPWSGRTYVAQLQVACSTLDWSSDAGSSWLGTPCTSTPPVEDHEKLAVGPAATPLGLPTVYYSWYNFAKAVWVARSIDGGFTFTTAAVQGPADMQPVNTGPVEADRSGNVYLPLYLCDHDGWVGVGVSHDAGLSFHVVKVSGGPRSCDDLELDPGVGVDADGTVYLAFDRPDGVQYAFSRDHGESWSAPVRVQPPGLLKWRNVDVVAGDAGRIAIAYRGNVDSAKPTEMSDGWAAWRLYVSFVANAASARPDITTALVPGVTQRGAICQHFEPVCPNGRNLGDFLDVQTTPDGRVVVAYDVGCPDAGCETPGDSQLSRGVVSIETEGPRLFATRAPWAS